MFEHHRQTLENLKTHFEKQGDALAFIVYGSVARGDALGFSDVDCSLVVSDEILAARVAQDAVCLEAKESLLNLEAW
jgi:predicted nucleotidyltransferase